FSPAETLPVILTNAIAFAKIVDEIGLPRGVFNLVLGRGETVGQELAGNPKVAMVSMTGSVSAGEKIMATAAKNITKVCNCAERIYVQKGIYDQFVNRLGEAMQAVQFG
ncbi:aldehyde dehydrogenase family protein, partial [Escherichia coli]